jgi:hypothetical protein
MPFKKYCISLAVFSIRHGFCMIGHKLLDPTTYFPYFHFRTGTDPVSITLCSLFFIWDRSLWNQSVCFLCYSSFEQHSHCESSCCCNIALICCDLIGGSNCYLCAVKAVLNMKQFHVITQYYLNFPLPHEYHKYLYAENTL